MPWLKLALALISAYLFSYQIRMENKVVAPYWALVSFYWLINYFDGVK